MWDFPLAMFVIASIITFLCAIFDKDIKDRFGTQIIVLGSIAMGAIGGILAVIIELIESLWNWLIK